MLFKVPFFKTAARVQALKCRRAGATDEQIAQAIEAVRVCCGQFAGQEPEEDDVRAAIYEQLSGLRLSGAPAIDPATIMLLVQLCILIYKALKAAGYLSSTGGFSSSVGQIREFIGEL